MGNSSSSGGGSETVNSPPQNNGGVMPRTYFTGTAACDPASEAMVGVKLAPYNEADVAGAWGFGLSAVCGKVDGSTKAVKFSATGQTTYTNADRVVNDSTQQCPDDSYATSVGLSAVGGSLGVQLGCTTTAGLSAAPSNWQYLALRAGATPGDPTTAIQPDQAQSDYDAAWAKLLKTQSAPAATPPGPT